MILHNSSTSDISSYQLLSAVVSCFSKWFKDVQSFCFRRVSYGICHSVWTPFAPGAHDCSSAPSQGGGFIAAKGAGAGGATGAM